MKTRKIDILLCILLSIGILSLLIVCIDKHNNIDLSEDQHQKSPFQTLEKNTKEEHFSPNLMTEPTQNKIQWKKIIVRVFSDFCTSEFANNIFLSMCPNREQFPNITFTTNNDYTHAVVINTPQEKILVPKEYVLGLALEPLFYLRLTSDFILYAQQNIGQYYIGDTANIGLPFTCRTAFLWHTPLSNIQFTKNRLMSIIFSNKKETIGQCYRHTLVNEILTKNIPIDVWGRGCENLGINDSRIMGGFELNEPYESYQFTIAIENCEHSCYISEKFINPLMVKTIPLYWGAHCAKTEFPNCFIQLTGNLETDLQIIDNVLNNPSAYIKDINYQALAEQCDLVQHLQELFLL
jgi:hypothetical protein